MLAVRAEVAETSHPRSAGAQALSAALLPNDVRRLFAFASPSEREEIAALVAEDAAFTFWRPLPGPQTFAYHADVDVLGYGGGAGGGKTDLAIGKALMRHRRIAYFRVDGTELTSVIDRIEELLGNRDGYNGQERIWRRAGPRRVQIEFGSVPNPGDERKYRGRPKDLLVIDEAGEWQELPIRFLMGWVRTTDPGQKTQTLLCFNPPTKPETRWIIDFFAPWLDPAHPFPAMPGEIRWFAMLKGHKREIEVASGEPFEFNGELVIPQSRTFIPALVGDNPFLYGTNYMAQLQALPEPLRSQMLYGDMQAGIQDDARQVIPSAWVKLAMSRWQPKVVKPEMMSMGVDPARGGDDNTELARRHVDWWFDEPIGYPGKQTPDGPTVAGMVIVNLRDRAVVHIDVDGIGASPYDFLVQQGFQTIGIKNATATPGQTDKSGMLVFANLRSMLWWRFRELLDPNANNGIALPPDKRLFEELTMPRWELRGKTIYVESRDDLLDPRRLGRSPDRATAYVMAAIETTKVRQMTALQRELSRQASADYDPMDPRNWTRQ